MIVREVIKDMLGSMWPMIVFVSVVAISLRIAFLFKMPYDLYQTDKTNYHILSLVLLSSPLHVLQVM